MQQIIPHLAAPLAAHPVSDNRIRVDLPDAPSVEFAVVQVTTLTERLVGEILGGHDDEALLVWYQRASREARAKLRAAEISYAGDDGRIFLRAPGLYVEREAPLQTQVARGWDIDHGDSTATRNPFAVRGSRVPRWLLLHHRRAFGVSELAQAVDLSPPAVSRLLRALEDWALVHDESVESDDGRRRNIMLTRPRRLLDEWAPRWERRRIRQRWWDIGARDADEALALLGEAMADEPGWAVGSLAGAARWQRAVEPADVLVWVDRDRLASLMGRLDPQRGRGPAGRGALRVAVAPDPWVLTLAQPERVRVADPVQLWLDCATEGERALEAADAIAQEMGW
jgi:DNA-binding transcriptional ArsR family regulator